MNKSNFRLAATRLAGFVNDLHDNPGTDRIATSLTGIELTVEDLRAIYAAVCGVKPKSEKYPTQEAYDAACTALRLQHEKIRFIKAMVRMDHDIQMSDEDEFTSETTNAMWVGWQLANGVMR